MENKKYLESIKENLKLHIKNDVSTGAERPLNAYLDYALDLLKRRYQIVNKRSSFATWTRSNINEIMNVWASIVPELTSTIEEYIKDCRMRKMTKDIKAASAKAIVLEAMKEAGLKHQFECQAYRAKIRVLISDNRSLTVYIPYKSLTEQLPQAVQSILIIKKEMAAVPKTASINKAYYGEVWV